MLDVDVIRRRRQHLMLSRRALGVALGVSGNVISSLEEGSNHHTLTLSFVDKLAAALAVDPILLFASETKSPVPASEAPPDAVVAAVGGLLAEMSALVPVSAIAESLDLSFGEVDVALTVLEERLPELGLSLHRLKGDVGIRPAAVIDPEPLKRLVRKHQGRSGMNLTEARILARALAGTLFEHTLGNADTVALGRLRNADLISQDGVDVTDDVRVSFTGVLLSSSIGSVE